MSRRSPILRKTAKAISYGCVCVYLLSVRDSSAAPAGSARITRVMNEVFQSERVAVLNAPVPDRAVVRTGAKSRAEIVSSATAVTRLGANTICNFEDGSRIVNLREGAVLFQVPHGVGRMKVKTGGIAVETAGTTGIIERYKDAYVKLLILEGTARAYLDRVGESVLVESGQMLITKPGPKLLPEAVHFDLEQLSRTSLLMNKDFAPLASRARIARAIQEQRADPDFIRTNLVIFGRGTLVNLVEPTPRPGGPQPSPESRAKSRPSP